MTSARGRTHIGRPLALAVVAALALAVSAPATAAPVDSGIAGVVRGADCTLTREGRSCSGRRSIVAIEVYRELGAPPVATARAGPLGTFRVRLVPGRYLLRVTFPGVPPAADRAVLVRPHAFTLVVVQRASRIR